MHSPGYHYARSRVRLTELLGAMDDAGWCLPVAACPGWRVRDVLAHLVGNVEDAMAGQLSVPPEPAQTNAQVARHAHDDPAALLRSWGEVGELVEDAITAGVVWPAAIDVLTHEHDVRGALGRPGARDDESVRFLARQLVQGLDSPVPLTVVVDGETVLAPTVGDSLRLETTAFEVFRMRLGRRSLDQVRALAWSDDPGSVVDHLFVFGPTAEPIIE